MTQRFYHLTSWVLSPENIGQAFTTISSDTSYYWTQKLTLSGVESAREANFRYLEEIGVPGPSIGPFSEVMLHAKYAQELLKEYIFEEVRKAEFTSAPSRKKCMFLFEPSPDPWLYLSKLGLMPTERRLIEVEPIAHQSSVMPVDSRHLDCNMEVYASIVEHARRYWSGSTTSNPTIEVLLEGCFTLTRIIT